MQTSAADYRSGWRYYRSWKQRFWRSTRQTRWVEPNARDLIYLADCYQIHSLELYDETELARSVDDQLGQKAAFMKAYLSVAALESRHFERQVRQLLVWQTRLRAPNILGFWFSQSDLSRFGYGVSPFFQGESISVFCERPDQIDFADISSVLPFDQITIRHPKRSWVERTSQKLADHVRKDLAFDGIETEIQCHSSGELLNLSLDTPDYGHDLSPYRLRASRAAALYQELVRSP